jgi:hypothetical protein
MFFHGCSILGTCPNCVIDFGCNTTPTAVYDEGKVRADR